MEWYTRYLEYNPNLFSKPGKVFVLHGPRRVGKTELIKKLLSGISDKIYTGTGDNLELREALSSQRLSTLSLFFKGYDILFIDEAQQIKDVGLSLKLLIDHFPEKMIIVTGSSSFDLSREIGEPLTGRNINRVLYPLSVMELYPKLGGIKIIELLDSLLLYGGYPEVLTAKTHQDKTEYLFMLRDSYLFRDILHFENIRNPDKLTDLLKLLAFQIGHEVSLNELGNNLGIAKQTVERYLDLLEKSFIIKKVGGFSRNLRKEVSKSARYYFWDNGIRNSLINNFNSLPQRNDIGMLWENFLFMERLKTKHYSRIYSNDYFWRTYDQQEIDLIEERDGKLFGYEFKYKNQKEKVPKSWKNAYPESEFKLISKDNFLEFLL